MSYGLIINEAELSCTLTADGPDTFQEMLIIIVGNLDIPIRTKIELAALGMIKKYDETYHKSNKGRSRIWEAGAEIELAKCYLLGKKIKQCGDDLSAKFRLKTSKSAISRYYEKFQKMGFVKGNFINRNSDII